MELLNINSTCPPLLELSVAGHNIDRHINHFFTLPVLTPHHPLPTLLTPKSLPTLLTPHFLPTLLTPHSPYPHLSLPTSPLPNPLLALPTLLSLPQHPPYPPHSSISAYPPHSSLSTYSLHFSLLTFSLPSYLPLNTLPTLLTLPQHSSYPHSSSTLSLPPSLSSYFLPFISTPSSLHSRHTLLAILCIIRCLTFSGHYFRFS